MANGFNLTVPILLPSCCFTGNAKSLIDTDRQLEYLDL